MKINTNQMNHGTRILVVDDHASARQSVADILTAMGHGVVAKSSAVEALAYLECNTVDLICTDLMMPGMDGLEFIQAITKRRIDSQIVMFTAHATIDTAVQAMRLGAFDYIEKPFDIDQLEDVAGRALRHGQLIDRRSSVPTGDNRFPVMIGKSSSMLQLQQRIAQAAPTDETILVSGESGTGKELVAKAIHGQSLRSANPWVGLNCPALSAQLMESELFGHEKGAFTSADAPRVGRFELAEGGTILLDEVTEIDLGLQAKLLRVLQERTFERVGSSQTRPLNVRVVASTNRDLHKEVKEGRFREDLYFRLAVIPIQVPPLRRRKEDVPMLADHFLAMACQRIQRDQVSVSSCAHQMLVDYHWPGNVRELENLMTRVAVLQSGSGIYADDLRPWLIDPVVQYAENVECFSPQTPSIPVGVSLQEMERKMVEAALDQFQGHREKTAQALGIGVRTLTNKLRAYGYAPREKSFLTKELRAA